jgi:hypothetical protein
MLSSISLPFDASSDCQGITFKLYTADATTGDITSQSPVASYTGQLCQATGDFMRFGLPPSFEAIGTVSPAYALTWTLTSGAYISGPSGDLATPAAGLTAAISMLYKGRPQPDGNWQPLQVNGRDIPLLDNTAALRIRPDGSSSTADSTNVHGIAFYVPPTL